MNITILLHSTTGNTRLIARYASKWLQKRGHDVHLVDIHSTPPPPQPENMDLSDTDLLVVANPSMYFRPTVAMERFVSRLPAREEGEPRAAFLLGTCMGEPGAHFALLAETLEPKGWPVIGAHWVLCPSNYPTHLAAVKRLQGLSMLRPRLDHHLRALRPLWWSLWPDGEPDEGDREELDSALRGLLHTLRHHDLTPLRPNDLYRGIPTCNAQGRLFPVELLDRIVGIEVLEDACVRCGACVRACPAGVLTHPSPEGLPEVGTGCMGCFACYNACPEAALKAVATPPGRGVYKGPSPSMRALFSL